VGHAFERQNLCYNGLANKPFEFRNGFDIVGQWKVSSYATVFFSFVYVPLDFLAYLDGTVR